MKAIEAFDFNVERARSLLALYVTLRGQGMSHARIDDLLRSSYVLAVGALDAYVHDRIGERLVPFMKRAIANDPAALEPVERELKDVEVREMLAWLTRSRPFVQVRKVVEDRLGFQSFQHPGKIEEALKLIGKTEVWTHVSTELNVPVRDLKGDLIGFGKRRNQIVHEGDRERSRLRRHRKRPVAQADVEEVLNLIERVGRSIESA